MPEIIPETRGRSPLPESESKKMISFRISPQALQHLESHLEWVENRGEKTTKAKALEVAICRLPIC